MADIFISYAREDAARIKPIIEALESQGWSVWWDDKIPHGKMFDRIIEEELSIAKCVVVIWSKNSISSEWIRNEAHVGAERRVLVPVLIDEVQVPLRFQLMQTSRLYNSKKRITVDELERLVESVKTIVHPELENKIVKRNGNGLAVDVPNPEARAMYVGMGMGVLAWLLVYFSPDRLDIVGLSSIPAMCGVASTYHYIKRMPVPVSYKTVIRYGAESGVILAFTCWMLQHIFTKGLATGNNSDWFSTVTFPLKCIVAGIFGSIISLRINRRVKGY